MSMFTEKLQRFVDTHGAKADTTEDKYMLDVIKYMLRLHAVEAYMLLLHAVEAADYIIFQHGKACVTKSMLEPWANYVAVDQSGQVWQYENAPTAADQGYYEVYDGNCLYVCSVGSICEDWKKMLFAVTAEAARRYFIMQIDSLERSRT